jgi:hypothetical protein
MGSYEVSHYLPKLLAIRADNCNGYLSALYILSYGIPFVFR